MRRDILELDLATSRVFQGLSLTLGDVEAIRLLLAGGSVIDWHKAAFQSPEDVDRLLHVYHLDPHDPATWSRVRTIFDEAVSYVETYFQLRVPDTLRNPAQLRDIFLTASDTRGFRRNQVLCCMILKLMHVVQHLDAADLRTRTSISDSELLELAHRDVRAASRRMMQEGVPIVAFYGSKKTRMSVVSKLLGKRDDVAARIFDKLRYRVIVPEPSDLVTALTWMIREVFPFNQVLPGQSHNNLLDPQALDQSLDVATREQLQALIDDPVRLQSAKNTYSGKTFRMINFVVDLPVRLPPERLPPESLQKHEDIVFVTAEFQVVDEQTSKANEEGENAHKNYKARQMDLVRRRLTRGQFTPK